MNKGNYILIVEDSQTQARQIELSLKPLGHPVFVALDPKDAIKMLKKEKAILVIADILMPEMDGYQLCRVIKSDMGLKDMPVVLLTRLSDPKEIIKGLECSADDFIVKPYSEELLLTRIRTILALKARHDKLATPNHDDNKINTSGIEVAFGGERYVITASRRQALNFLLSIYENAVQQNRDLILMQKELQALNEQLEEKVMDRTQQLEASERSFRTLAENASDGILILNEKGENIYVNKQTSEITGFSMDQLLNIGIKDIIHPDELPAAMEICRKRLEGIQMQAQHESVIIKKDGRNIPVEITCSKTIWHDQPAIMSILRDISWRKKIEEEFLRSSKLDSISVLAGGIAHDFNNLLTGIIGNISLAMAYVTPQDRVYNILSNLEKASLKAKDLTQHLLTFAKGGAPIKDIVSLPVLIRDSASFALSGSNFRGDFSIADNICLVEADEGQISQVIHNLVLNAEQAKPADGIIRISAENLNVTDELHLPLKDGKYAAISVNDRGSGIHKENISRIFDPYFTTKERGSGLGLATVYSIIKNHGGLITVDSDTEAGTTFKVYLPASQKQVKAFPVTNIGEKPVTGKGRIMVMDDEEIIRDTAGSMLTTLGYEVNCAKDGAEAINLYKKAQLEREPFALIIMDLTIQGGMGGKEAILKLREIDPDVRVIVSSGYSEDALMSDYKKHGFSAVIAKPYKLAELSKIVQKVISKSKVNPAKG